MASPGKKNTHIRTKLNENESENENDRGRSYLPEGGLRAPFAGSPAFVFVFAFVFVELGSYMNVVFLESNSVSTSDSTLDSILNSTLHFTLDLTLDSTFEFLLPRLPDFLFNFSQPGAAGA